jgi:hypothetical protein
MVKVSAITAIRGIQNSITDSNKNEYCNDYLYTYRMSCPDDDMDREESEQSKVLTIEVCKLLDNEDYEAIDSLSLHEEEDFNVIAIIILLYIYLATLESIVKGKDDPRSVTVDDVIDHKRLLFDFIKQYAKCYEVLCDALCNVSEPPRPYSLISALTEKYIAPVSEIERIMVSKLFDMIRSADCLNMYIEFDDGPLFTSVLRRMCDRS